VKINLSIKKWDLYIYLPMRYAVKGFVIASEAKQSIISGLPRSLSFARNDSKISKTLFIKMEARI
jgi:hypothetical protein